MTPAGTLTVWEGRHRTPKGLSISGFLPWWCEVNRQIAPTKQKNDTGRDRGLVRAHRGFRHPKPLKLIPKSLLEPPATWHLSKTLKRIRLQ